MALILTFLGSGVVERSHSAIASAKRLAASGQRVLLAFQDSGPAPGLLLGQPLSADPSPVDERLSAVQFRSATLLERSWDEVKALETQYLRTPILKDVYGQELGVLPGMDSALALNALRQYDSSGEYDTIVYDGSGDMTALRMWGMADVLDWYVRRFTKVFQQSDLGKTVVPFIQPIAAAVLSVDWSGGNLIDKPTGEVRSILDQGREAINDPNRVMAFLVTGAEESAIATTRYLWGSAQQVGLTVGAVLLSSGSPSAVEASFAPLPVHSLPTLADGNWQPLIEAIPDPRAIAQSAPRPVTIDAAAGTVSLFLPSFDKSQIKLIQSGPEVTIEAGDQRRNLFLPPALAGRAVKGAKFQDQHLVLSFG